MNRKTYIERRLIELSHKEKRDSLDIQEEKDLEKELNELMYKDIKKESYKLPLNISMYDMCYCSSKCITSCGRKQSSVGIHTASDFSKVCSDYKEKK